MYSKLGEGTNSYILMEKSLRIQKLKRNNSVFKATYMRRQ
jgi:hypothetical protein